MNIRYIQKMLGHASITTTQIYTYVTTREGKRDTMQTRHPRNKINIGENFDNFGILRLLNLGKICIINMVMIIRNYRYHIKK